jgi:hypothetical protein
MYGGGERGTSGRVRVSTVVTDLQTAVWRTCRDMLCHLVSAPALLAQP